MKIKQQLKKIWVYSSIIILTLAVLPIQAISVESNKRSGFSENVTVKTIPTVKEEKGDLSKQDRQAGLDFSKNIEAAADWSNQHYPEIPLGLRTDDDVAEIKSLNDQLRTKYLNRVDMYEDQEQLDWLDKFFNSEFAESVTLYANFRPSDFGFQKEHIISENELNEDALDQLLSETSYGIDHGFFLGSLTQKPMDVQENEVIQIRLTVPKGIKNVRIGSFSESYYILPRKQFFHYSEIKYITAENQAPYITIDATFMEEQVLTNQIASSERALDRKLINDYNLSFESITLTPLGLNAGAVFAIPEKVVECFDSLATDNKLEQLYAPQSRLIFSNGLGVHSEDYWRTIRDLPIEEQREAFEEEYMNSGGEQGITYPYGNRTSTTIVTMKQYTTSLSDKKMVSYTKLGHH